MAIVPWMSCSALSASEGGRGGMRLHGEEMGSCAGYTRQQLAFRRWGKVWVVNHQAKVGVIQIKVAVAKVVLLAGQPQD